jgi:rfaE bifunctional protein nucleotidyltransferase chain/domain
MKVVLVHGCFDLLHYGHLEYFKSAKKYGDFLCVSVTTDRYVNKGPGRPVFPTDVRANMLRALEIVDHVIISDSPTAVDVIKKIRPHFYVKGPDYRGVDTPDMQAEIAAAKEVGAEFICTDDDTHSSSALANRFFVNWSDPQQAIISQIKELGGLVAIEAALERVKTEVDCLIMGECIWDIYRFVKPEGISSKSPTISARYIREEKYRGGAWAIANHIKSFCDVGQVESGAEHKKIRYISEDTGQRLFEVTEIPEEWPDRETRLIPTHNMMLVADFGHGCIGKVRTEGFLALNVQTNSSNYGFNSFRKHTNFDYLVVDLRELRLAYQDRNTTAEDLGMWAHSAFKKPIAVTLGSEGSLFYKDGAVYKCPAFCDSVVDAIGAGDAFLAITSLLVKTNAHPALIGFLGNVFAGLKAKIIGNKSAVSKESLLRTCTAILR